MRKLSRCLTTACLFVLLLCARGALARQPSPIAIWCEVMENTSSSTRIDALATEEGASLFLPACADLSSLRLYSEDKVGLVLASQWGSAEVMNGTPLDLLSLFPEGVRDGVYQLQATDGEAEEAFSLQVMKSENLASLYIMSDAPVEEGREWVDAAPVEEKRSAEASLTMLGANGNIVYDDSLREVRGRGNTTWEWGEKKPYQIKLEIKTDLLESGDEENRERTWLLLAEAFDSTLLHNTVTLQLGRALGLRGTPECRAVDLYYDGAYRGYYLLCEKVHVKPGRLDIFAYGDFVEEGYPSAAFFPREQAQNAYGHDYQYVEGVESSLGQRGAYLIEMDAYGYQSGASWFEAGDGKFYELHSPEYASRADVEYVSGLMEEMLAAIKNGGVNPDTGKAVGDYLDLDSMARFFLVQEYAKTCDFWYTSTYFYIPEGEGKLYAGPLWDFDIAYGIRDDRPFEAGVEDYVPESGWLMELAALPAFQETVKETYLNEFEPLLSRFLLIEEREGSVGEEDVRTLNELTRLTEASRRMNDQLWPYGGGYRNINKETLYPTYAENWAFFDAYLRGRHEWMNADVSLWSGYSIDKIGLNLAYRNADVAKSALVEPASRYQNYTAEAVAWSAEKNEEAPYETAYSVDIRLRAVNGARFSQGAAAAVNGDTAELVMNDGEEATVRFRFKGPTYEPAIWDGVDYGILYQHDYFALHNPEVARECGGDPEQMLEHYVLYGMSEGLRAIETFDYDAYYEKYGRLLDDYYMGDVEMSTQHYLDNGEAEELLGTGALIAPRGMR